MEMMPTPEKRKEKAFVVFGENGHEREYVFTMPYSKEDYVPSHIESDLQELLGKEWKILDRGTRIEIGHQQYGKQDNDVVIKALQTILGDGYELVFMKK